MSNRRDNNQQNIESINKEKKHFKEIKAIHDRLKSQVDAYSSFKVYRNYLLGLAKFIRKTYGDVPFKKLKEACITTLNQVQRRNSFDSNDLRKFLFMSWSTESLLLLNSNLPPEILKFANFWVPVQSYYSIFLSLQALFSVMYGKTRPTDHQATLKSIAGQIKDRGLFPEPWNVYCVGSVAYKQEKYINFPPDVYPRTINQGEMAIKSPKLKDFWQRYAMFLRTTRERQFEKRKLAIRRKRLKYDEKIKIYDSLSPTTFFDCLYRLRIRSNYEDADSFIFSTRREDYIKEFYSSFLTLTQATLFLNEIYISSYCGINSLKQHIEDFKKQDNLGITDKTILKRAEYL